VSSKATKHQEDLLNDLAFVSMTLDGGQIGTMQLFATNFAASNISHYFTQFHKSIRWIMRSSEICLSRSSLPFMTEIFRLGR
jgi:hypothetical protein